LRWYLPSDGVQGPDGGATAALQALHLRYAVFSRRGVVVPRDEDGGDGKHGFFTCGRGDVVRRDGAAAACTRTGAPLVWEQRLYAHRLLRHVAVAELRLVGEGDGADDGEGAGPAVYVNPLPPLDAAVALFAPATPTQPPPPPPDDLPLHDVTEVAVAAGLLDAATGATVRLQYGVVAAAEVPGFPRPAAVMLTTRWPTADDAVGLPHVGDVLAAVTVVVTSLDLPPADAACDATSASIEVADAIVGTRACHAIAAARAAATAAPWHNAVPATTPVDDAAALVALAVHMHRAAAALAAANVLLTSHAAAWADLPPAPGRVIGFINRWPEYVASVMTRNLRRLLADSPSPSPPPAAAVLAGLLPPPLWRSRIDLPLHATATSPPELVVIALTSQYSLLSFSRHDWPFGASPGGLSTNGYNGHQFWDMDVRGRGRERGCRG